MIKTLIVDDSDLVRSIIKDFLGNDGSFEIVGEANNGIDGVKQAQLLNPDLITMDIEMPEMNGLDAIKEINKFMTTAIVVVTTHDTAKMAYDATVKGALEFYSKGMFTSQMSAAQREEILNTLKQITGIKARVPVQKSTVQEARIEPRLVKAVVIASSTGGPKALCQICSGIPQEFPVPIILVQHNTSGFDRGFAQWLDGYMPLRVSLAEEGVMPVRGNLYVAPTDRHLLLDNTGFVFNNGEQVHNQKPAADLLFKSAAALYGNSLVSIVLTGMGCDGADGTRYVKQAGGITIAQDEQSSMIFGMPKAAVETGCVDITLPLDGIARRLVRLTEGGDKT